MDMSCIYQTILYLIEHLLSLRSITVWQPSEHTLQWFQGQLDDFTTSCRNRSLCAKVLYPQLFRRRAAAHWDLVQEVTLFDPSYPDAGPFENLFRGERNAIPLGLGAQYHLDEYKANRVRRHG
jgi:hypothetical protein